MSVDGPANCPTILTSQTPAVKDKLVIVVGVALNKEMGAPPSTVLTNLSPINPALGACVCPPLIVPPVCDVVLILNDVPEKVSPEYSRVPAPVIAFVFDEFIMLCLILSVVETVIEDAVEVSKYPNLTAEEALPPAVNAIDVIAAVLCSQYSFNSTHVEVVVIGKSNVEYLNIKLPEDEELLVVDNPEFSNLQ